MKICSVEPFFRILRITLVNVQSICILVATLGKAKQVFSHPHSCNRSPSILLRISCVHYVAYRCHNICSFMCVAGKFVDTLLDQEFQNYACVHALSCKRILPPDAVTFLHDLTRRQEFSTIPLCLQNR
jgi:hypothetical protein